MDAAAAAFAATAGAAGPDEASRLRARVAALEAEVALLQGKLAALHATDLNALRRAHASLVQHVAALAAEAHALEARLGALETAVWDPRLLLREAAVVSACGAGAYGLHALLCRERGMPLWVRLAPFVLGGSYAVFHVVAGNEARWEGMARRNAARKAELLRQAALLAQRVAIMQELAEPSPAPAPPPAFVAVALGTPEELAAAEGGSGGAAAAAAKAPPRAATQRGTEAV